MKTRSESMLLWKGRNSDLIRASACEQPGKGTAREGERNIIVGKGKSFLSKSFLSAVCFSALLVPTLQYGRKKCVKLD